MPPKVYINCCTYNQVDFIRSALDGFVMQKTDFPFEAHINDDASTDGTQEIIREYAEKYPDIIKPHLRTVNTKGVDNYMDSWKRCESPYFANCEGDDYWTDPDKLQMQVDFLDSHPDYSGCCHAHRLLVVEENEFYGYFPYPETIELKHLCERMNEIPAASVLYRWRFNRTDCKVEEWYPDGIEPGDWFMHLAHLQCGNFKYIDRSMSVYRKHKNGIWYGFDSKDKEAFDKFWIRMGIKHLKFLDESHKRFGMDIEKRKKTAVKNTLFAAARNANTDVLFRLIELHFENFQEILKDFEDTETFLKSKNGKKTIRYAQKIFSFFSKVSFGKGRRFHKLRLEELNRFYKKIKMEEI